MRLTSVLAATFLSCVLGLTAAPAQAHNTLASSAPYVATNADANSGTSLPAAVPTPQKTMLIGKITNPAGTLPGAVVILTGTRQMAVTNADGEFEFEIPANAGALQAVVTYAGYADEPMTLNASADESTVSLTNARVIVVSRKQQLKHYIKTAHKQVKRELRQARS